MYSAFCFTVVLYLSCFMLAFVFFYCLNILWGVLAAADEFNAERMKFSWNSIGF